MNKTLSSNQFTKSSIGLIWVNNPQLQECFADGFFSPPAYMTMYLSMTKSPLFAQLVSEHLTSSFPALNFLLFYCSNIAYPEKYVLFDGNSHWRTVWWYLSLMAFLNERGISAKKIGPPFLLTVLLVLIPLTPLSFMFWLRRAIIFLGIDSRVISFCLLHGDFIETPPLVSSSLTHHELTHHQFFQHLTDIFLPANLLPHSQ